MFTRWLMTLLWCSFATGVVYAQKNAYRHYCRGATHYGEGHYKQAEAHFRQAHDAIPDNFYFAAALGLAMSRAGHHQAGRALLDAANRLVSPKDPEYAAKRAAWHFFVGMSYLYAGKASHAIAPLRRAIAAEERSGDGRKLSIFHNALGYALLLHQGQGAHVKAGLAPHYHVHRPDLERAAEQFEQALRYDPDNAVALLNYRTIADTLGLPHAQWLARADSLTQQRQLAPVFSAMPARIDQLLQLGRYEDVLFLVDISGSMVMEKVICLNQDRFSVMKEMALYLVGRLPARTRLGLATIGGDCDTPPLKWMPVGSLSHKDLKEEIHYLYPDGTTPLLTMLVKSPELFEVPDSVAKSIFLISDGENVCRVGNLDICAWAAGLAGRNITIHVLTFLDAGLHNTGAFAEYTCLADYTGGKVIYIDNYRCSVELFDFNLLETCQLAIPPLRRSDCYAPVVQDMWAIFPGEKR